ncbi:MAG: response regulator [Elusimicrobia bacterium]|nr:response regulator [Elusimicrobiota bacterium]
MNARLLIIDDEADLVEALAMRFSVSGFDVETAPDGPAGLESAHRRRPDVVLLDVAMPGMSGWDVCRRLKSDPETKGTPVLIMTAAMLRGSEEAARAAGADGVVKKPFDDRRLVETVRSLVGPKAGAA